jgi:hypothetical protein
MARTIRRKNIHKAYRWLTDFNINEHGCLQWMLFKDSKEADKKKIMLFGDNHAGKWSGYKSTRQRNQRKYRKECREQIRYFMLNSEFEIQLDRKPDCCCDIWGDPL